jgi:superfamily I DNA/RNA helicase
MSGLTEAQRAMATAGVEEVLALAGPGSGKTATLTWRIVHLVSPEGCGIPARSVVAVTFTRKAARELAERAVRVGGELAKGVRVSTFHSLASRLLRSYWWEAGLLSSSFETMRRRTGRREGGSVGASRLGAFQSWPVARK